MRQSVARLGATIDTATPEEVAAIIADAFSHQAINEYSRKKGVINLDANGNGDSISAGFSKELRVSSQFDWFLERVTIGGGALAASALVKFYENQITDSDMLEVIGLGTAGEYSDSFSNCVYVPSNSVVVIGITGGPANGQVTFNLQVRTLQHPGVRA